jgi:putative ABC transport system substrate-binding protein
MLRMRAALVGLAVFGMVACGEPTQHAPKAYRVGFLAYGPAEETASAQASDFQQGLRDVGYVEGRDIVVDYRYGNVDQLYELAAALVRAPVDVIVAVGDPAALAAKKATSTIPIVVTEYAGDPVKAGLASSLGHPGGNVTGLTTRSDELWETRLGRLRELVPQIRSVAVLWNPANPNNASCRDEIARAAQSTGMRARTLEVSDARTLETAFVALAKEPADALVPCWDGGTRGLAKAIADFAVKARVPTVGAVREYVDAGVLLSVGTNLAAQRRQAAYYVDRIRKGSKPGEVPIEQAAAFDTVVNLGTAKRIGIALPPYFLQTIDDRVE